MIDIMIFLNNYLISYIRVSFEILLLLESFHFILAKNSMIYMYSHTLLLSLPLFFLVTTVSSSSKGWPILEIAIIDKLFALFMEIIILKEDRYLDNIKVNVIIS
jgi:hypothetical protein